MHRAFVILMALFLLVLALLGATPRHVLQQVCDNVALTAPGESATVRGNVEIQGSASIAEFLFYKVEYSTSANPERWNAVSTTYREPVVNGRLDVWNTATVRDGVYNLKLTVVDRRSQEVCRVTVRQIQVANRTTPTSTASPTGSPTPLPTLPAGGTPATRLLVTQVTVTPSPGRTPIPSPTRSSLSLIDLPRGEDIARALELPKIMESFFLGMGTAIAIFVLLGLVTLVRRLL